MSGDRFSRLDHLMRDAIIRKAERNGDFKKLAEFQKAYWVNQGNDFFERTNDSFETAFLPDCAFIFDVLEEQLAMESSEFNTLVEIGTGNGKVLNFLSSKFPHLRRLVGIDLSPVQIEKNKRSFQENARLEFVAADGFDWVNEHGRNRTIFVTSRGVLEYFTENRLQEFFNKLNSLGKTIFVAIEPNGVDHDFSRNPGSQPYGHERSFSHNYAALFEKAGFELWHYSKKEYSRDCFTRTANLNSRLTQAKPDPMLFRRIVFIQDFLKNLCENLIVRLRKNAVVIARHIMDFDAL